MLVVVARWDLASIAMMCVDDDGVNLFRRNGKSLWWSSAKD